jgi:F-type H+-transporting ATPase subunit gamma
MGDALIDLRRRIKNTDDLRSVVKTMKAMSAASITPFEGAVTSLLDYYRTVELALSVALKSAQTSTQGLPATAAAETLPNGFLVFGTDQGMVGQFNEDLADQIIAKVRKSERPVVIWTVGERVQMRLENAELSVTRVFPTPGSVEAITALVTDILLELENSRDLGKVGVIFQVHNHPIVRGSYEHHCRQLLPLDQQWREKITKLPWPTKLLPEMIGFAPDDLATLVGEHLFTSIFKACTESCAAEHAARLVAMQLAEKNIEDRQQQLALDYNHQRQSTIDEELFDLISGFEALTTH